jgi:pyruvate/2-oxoglutarate dehydrogenase complex dihydrolipoamide dehydrogenase (E3) component
MSDTCDLIVLGLGVAGIEVAQQAAGAGLAVTAVECNLVGGECPYWGCIPSKVMVRAADTLAEAARVTELAGEVDISPDWALVARRVGETTNAWDDAAQAKRLQDRGVTLLRGTGTIRSPREITVDGQGLVAKRGIVISAGTVPVVPDIDGISGVAYWTNREAIEATQLPRSLLVLGAGAVGLELAQVFSRFGVQVTVVEARDHALPMEEPENSAAMDEVLRREGIDLRTATTCVSVKATDGGIVASLSSGDAVGAERLLVATGRIPDLRALGVAAAGLSPDTAAVRTDDHLRAADGVWAIGDLTGHGAFTHVAYYQAQVAAADIVGRSHAAADYSAVPRVTFTDPEVAGVGLTEAQARAAGLDVRVGSLPTAASGRGWLHGDGAGPGVVKLVADAHTDRLVGGSVMGPAAGEVIAFIGLAIRARIPITTVQEFIYPYPTFARAVKGALRRLGHDHGQ